MNLPELLIVIYLIFGGYFCGKFFGFYYGIVGWIGGSILGIVLAYIAYIVLVRRIGKLIIHHFPPYPECKNTDCVSRDSYDCIEFVPEGPGVILRCKCGARYYSTGRLFMEVLDNGEYAAYMKKNIFLRSWRKDNSNI